MLLGACSSELSSKLKVIEEKDIRNLTDTKGKVLGQVNCGNNDVYIYSSSDYPERVTGTWVSLDKFLSANSARVKARDGEMWVELGELVFKGLIFTTCEG